MNVKSHFTIQHLKPYTVRWIVYVLLVVLTVVFTMATALSVADFLKILFGTDTMPSVSSGNLISQWLEGVYGWLMSFGQQMALVLFSILLLIVYGLKNVFGYLSTVQIAVIRTKVIRDIRNSIFAKAMRLPMAYYTNHRKGDVLSRMSGDMSEYEENILNSIQILLSSVISMVLYIAMLMYINVKLTLFVLCMLPLVGIVVAGLSHRLKRRSKSVQEKNSYLISLNEETLSGLKEIKGYTAIEFCNQRFADFNRNYTKQRIWMYRRIGAASPVSDFLSNTIVIGILLFGSMLVLHGDNGLSAELFISYIMMFVLMIPPSKDLSTAISQIKKGQACADRLEDFLNIEDTVKSPVKPIAWNGLQKAIELKHVSFSYKEGVEVLKDINLTIEKGKTVAIVGSSGSGKSTLADLLLRFYDCNEGAVMVDGIDIRNISIEELRKHIGVVAQDTLLFNDSVRNNIAFSMPEASMEQIEQAARIASAHEFITTMSEGYDTNIGEGGGNLSGGQRQRISIARAVLRNPDILILDEATSALDSESEHQVQQALDQVMSNRTAVVIAHRLSTIMNADNIVVLEKGEIVEQGTHQELMAKGGRYSELVALQTFE